MASGGKHGESLIGFYVPLLRCNRSHFHSYSTAQNKSHVYLSSKKEAAQTYLTGEKPEYQ